MCDEAAQAFGESSGVDQVHEVAVAGMFFDADVRPLLEPLSVALGGGVAVRASTGTVIFAPVESMYAWSSAGGVLSIGSQ